VAHAFVYSVLLPCEVAHVQLEDVRHQGVEHVKAGCLLQPSPSVVHHVEDGRQDLVHALHVLHARVQPSEDEQDARHVVVPVRGLQLLGGRLPPGALIPADQPVLLPPGAGEERHGEGLSHPREERELRLCAAGVLLDLFPEMMVLLELGKQLRRGVAVDDDGAVPVLAGVQELADELRV
jgi:hypothetical protein